MAKKAKAAAPKPKKPVAPKKPSAESKPVKPRAKAASKSTPAKSKIAQKPAPVATPTVVSETVVAEVVVARPLAERFADFDAAKNATIDALLEIIEAAEARLCEVKQVQTFDDLEPLANGHL